VLKVSEVYEKQVRVNKERPDGSDYINFEKIYTTRECLLNTEYVVSIHPHEYSSSTDLKMIEGRFPEGTKFSTFVLDGNSFRTSEIVVVGSFEKFCRLLEENNP
jgi:hypothetical protein